MEIVKIVKGALKGLCSFLCREEINQLIYRQNILSRDGTSNDARTAEKKTFHTLYISMEIVKIVKGALKENWFGMCLLWFNW